MEMRERIGEIVKERENEGGDVWRDGEDAKDPWRGMGMPRGHGWILIK